MRRFLLFAPLVLLLVAVLFCSAGAVLASGGPFRPGSPFFSVQYFVEQRRADLTFSPTAKAIYLMRVTERRAADVVALAGQPAEGPAAFYLNENFDQALSALSKVQASELGGLRPHLQRLVGFIQAALSAMRSVPARDPALVEAMQTKVAALNALLGGNRTAGLPQNQGDQTGGDSAAPALAEGPAGTPGPAGIPEHAVAFPPGSAGALHAFFPLEGQHAALACQSCHVGGRYAGTASTCVGCHADVKPASHFSGDCAACHNPADWLEIQFDHTLAGAVDCQSCHLRERPASHFPGQCSACHSTSNWQSVRFNHAVAGATDCGSCHAGDRPADHFQGKCSACHSTTAWRPADFNHQGFTECRSCHQNDRPADHYEGQCSKCHSTGAWRPAHFDHGGLTDCSSCHSDDRPANHFQGQCGSCHNTGGWRPANFDHSGQSDCQSCHSDDRPGDHFQGQCSACHSTSAWQPANFDHNGLPDCQSCHDRPSNHFPGQCSNCHSTNSWGSADFSHEGLPDCQSCHDRPSGHYQGQCSNCHNTNSWEGASFDHSGLTDCQSCHDRPADHWPGQCSKCHNSNNWGDIDVNGHSFPMGHGDANGQCSSCHNGANPSVNCFKCHNRDETIKHHEEKGITDIASRCLECHPNGNKD